MVFGASGDLAARKLLPAMAALAEHRALPDGFIVMGVARTAWTDQQFRQAALDAAPTPGREWKKVVADSVTSPASTGRSRPSTS